jgi:hypothetical protein
MSRPKCSFKSESATVGQKFKEGCLAVFGPSEFLDGLGLRRVGYYATARGRGIGFRNPSQGPDMYDRGRRRGPASPPKTFRTSLMKFTRSSENGRVLRSISFLDNINVQLH